MRTHTHAHPHTHTSPAAATGCCQASAHHVTSGLRARICGDGRLRSVSYKDWRSYRDKTSPLLSHAKLLLPEHQLERNKFPKFPTTRCTHPVAWRRFRLPSRHPQRKEKTDLQSPPSSLSDVATATAAPRTRSAAVTGLSRTFACSKPLHPRRQSPQHRTVTAGRFISAAGASARVRRGRRPAAMLKVGLRASSLRSVDVG